MNWNVCASAGILAQDQGADTKALDAQPAPSPLGFPVRAFSVAGAPEATPVKKPAVAPAVDASFPAGNQTTEAAPNKTEVAPPPASLKVCCFCLFTKAHNTLILCMGYIKLPDTHFLNVAESIQREYFVPRRSEYCLFCTEVFLRIRLLVMLQNFDV